MLPLHSCCRPPSLIIIQSDFTNSPLPTKPEDISASCPLPIELCAATTYDSFLVSVAAWATLQLTWTSVLLASQLWQVARQMTTLEVSNLGRYGFMGGRAGANMSGQMGNRHNHRGNGQTVPGVDSEDTQSTGGGAHSHGHRHASGFLMNLLGFDRFTKGKAVDGLTRAGKAANPFDMGVVANCRDFWTNGKELGVEYEKLYDVPYEGFKEAKNRRAREDGDEAASTSSTRKRQGLFMGLMSSTWRGGASGSRGTYEPVNQV